MEKLTIGKLAKKVGMRASAIRYYEELGLIHPKARSASGYRIFDESAVQELRFIDRAQHLGFSLADIRILLDGWREGSLEEQEFLETAEERYFALERQITHLLTLQHELGLFLQDIYQSSSTRTPTSMLSQLIEHICINPLNSPQSLLFDRMLERAGCSLNSSTVKELMEDLRDQHIHVWNEGDRYSILVVSDDPVVETVLQRFTVVVGDCQAKEHRHQIPALMHNSDGYLLVVEGDHAFVIARLFLEISRQNILDSAH
jgi:DNA-binding transcriptional MerR regulator